MTLPKPAIGQSRAAEMQSQVPAEEGPSNRSTPQRLGKSPRRKFLLTPRKGVGFSLEMAHETSLVQIRWEGTSLEPIQVKDQPVRQGRNWKATQCQVERSLFWEFTRSLAATDNDLRVGNQLLYSKPKIIIKTSLL